MTYKLLTLDDLEGHWQQLRSVVLATAGLFIFDSARKNAARQLEYRRAGDLVKRRSTFDGEKHSSCSSRNHEVVTTIRLTRPCGAHVTRRGAAEAVDGTVSGVCVRFSLRLSVVGETRRDSALSCLWLDASSDCGGLKATPTPAHTHTHTGRHTHK